MTRGFALLLLCSFIAVFTATWTLTGSEAEPVTIAAKKVSATVPANCDEARADGVAPLLAGQPGYSAGLDPDGDGIACPPL